LKKQCEIDAAVNKTKDDQGLETKLSHTSVEKNTI